MTLWLLLVVEGTSQLYSFIAHKQLSPPVEFQSIAMRDKRFGVNNCNHSATEFRHVFCVLFAVQYLPWPIKIGARFAYSVFGHMLNLRMKIFNFTLQLQFLFVNPANNYKYLSTANLQMHQNAGISVGVHTRMTYRYIHYQLRVKPDNLVNHSRFMHVISRSTHKCWSLMNKTRILMWTSK